MKVGDLVRTIDLGALLDAPLETGLIVGIIENANPQVKYFKVLMSKSGHIIPRWEGDLEIVDDT